MPARSPSRPGRCRRSSCSGPSRAPSSTAVLQALSRQVELKLKDFGVDVQVVEVQPGPVVTRFELQPAPGIKVSRISGLAKDLARALSISSVRIVEVIPGKPVVGLEIPNEDREVVRLRKVEGMSRIEAAEAMGVGLDTIDRQLRLGIRAMADAMLGGSGRIRREERQRNRRTNSQ